MACCLLVILCPSQNSPSSTNLTKIITTKSAAELGKGNNPGFAGQNDTFWGLPAVSFANQQIKRLIEHLLEIAKIEYSQHITLEGLETTHYKTFIRTMANLLATESALKTLAQIIDSLPIANVAWDQRCHSLDPDHPLDEHEEICPGSIEKAQELRKDFDFSTLKFNPKVSNAQCGHLLLLSLSYLSRLCSCFLFFIYISPFSAALICQAACPSIPTGTGRI